MFGISFENEMKLKLHTNLIIIQHSYKWQKNSQNINTTFGAKCLAVHSLLSDCSLIQEWGKAWFWQENAYCAHEPQGFKLAAEFNTHSCLAGYNFYSNKKVIRNPIMLKELTCPSPRNDIFSYLTRSMMFSPMHIRSTYKINVIDYFKTVII